jgi:hypothetical protein
MGLAVRCVLGSDDAREAHGNGEASLDNERGFLKETPLYVVLQHNLFLRGVEVRDFFLP